MATTTAPNLTRRHTMINRPSWGRELIRFLVRTIYGCFFGLEVRAPGRVPPAGAAIVVSNHPTYLDPGTVLVSLYRPVFFVAWSDLFRWPVIGWLCRKFAAIEVDIEAMSHNTLRLSHQVLDQGELLGLFPEGGRSVEDPVDPFKRGAVHLAIARGVPIVPAVIYGAREVWPVTRAYPLPGPLRIQFLRPIEPAARAAGMERSPRELEVELTEELQRRYTRRLAAWRRLRSRPRSRVGRLIGLIGLSGLLPLGWLAPPGPWPWLALLLGVGVAAGTAWNGARRQRRRFWASGLLALAALGLAHVTTVGGAVAGLGSGILCAQAASGPRLKEPLWVWSALCGALGAAVATGILVAG